MKPYYKAYDERYKTIHAKGYSWASDKRTPIVMEIIKKYAVSVSAPVLEIGCGEGRDAEFLLKKGFHLLATDVSPEAIAYCRKRYPTFSSNFQVLDCLKTDEKRRFDFIYAIAVIHMLVTDEDRKAFYRFVVDHLSENGIALIAAMGDGHSERATEITEAFRLQERNHPSGTVTVAATSCRTVSFQRLEREISESGLQIIEKGITSRLPDFNSLMYAVVKRISE